MLKSNLDNIKFVKHTAQHLTYIKIIIHIKFLTLFPFPLLTGTYSVLRTS